jgi:hypothetical protein
MVDHIPDPFPVEENLFIEARAFALSIAAIRTARGKLNPADFHVGTPEWKAVIEDFAADILRLPSDSKSQFSAKGLKRSSE